jgi:hypothetical protein
MPVNTLLETKFEFLQIKQIYSKVKGYSPVSLTPGINENNFESLSFFIYY